MLVLSRKSRQSVFVGGSRGFERLLKVTVLDIGINKVSLGFEVDTEGPTHYLESSNLSMRRAELSANDRCP